MIKQILKNHLSSCLYLTFLALFAIAFGMAVAPIMILSSLYYIPKLAIYSSTTKPLTAPLINFTLWFLVFASLAIFHHFEAKAIKLDANRVLNAIEKYVEQHNKYPESIEMLKPQLPKIKYQVFYHNVEGQPVLLYSSNYDPFINHQYSFSEKKWIMWSKD